MKPTLKDCLRAIRWAAAITALFFTLFAMIRILFYGSVTFNEENTAWLLFEIGLVAFALILQFIPFKK